MYNCTLYSMLNVIESSLQRCYMNVCNLCLILNGYHKCRVKN